MPVEVDAKPDVLRWARERVSLSPSELASRLGWKKADRIIIWEQSGRIQLKHLERLAEKTYTPIGYLFLDTPPEERLPIPDFRTVAGHPPERPSPNLLDTVYQAQLRQSWFREHLLQYDEEPLPFVGRATLNSNPESVGAEIRDAIAFDTTQRAQMATWEEALRTMFDNAESAGVLIMRNGIVGNNTHRKLDVTEFRGFTISDEFAPLIFVNAADTKAAQMFTLAHELAHVWLNVSGVSNWRLQTSEKVERFCNAVAAEVLVPMAEFKTKWDPAKEPIEEARRLARRYKTSSLVLIIRAYEAAFLSRSEFDELYDAEKARFTDRVSGGGGDFYLTQRSRIGRRFARAVIAGALEGSVPFKEAFQLLGLKRSETFMELAKSLGVAS
ncbi:ImmA/IrrE family metallo-endopeptidase [Fimbriimonadia bacterium ATM]|nr:MAG: ImmA/IrrE family metallo-endopeptidase [Armatimonadota bacterium]MBC6970658.1 ImmA/IrrE family metallo-endopeptidase [Armatimonadota bacterium]MCE7899603.1 ImmA/IrrE family metallo-endopeptidase [Armatimonadetes bacterium ATM1]MDL1927689.1 ImmA/IrrE family metallo-endopeptidase [Fimbriimonadia bacterium ATM]RIJ96384.1 MAG: DNA-binding protein [Armatimonadota bacterium]